MSRDSEEPEGPEGPEGPVYINAEDGMPNSHPVLRGQLPALEAPGEEEEDRSELPRSLIVTSIHPDVFASEELKRELERPFRTFSEDVSFQWLPSFRRLRVNYPDAGAAAAARVRLHRLRLAGSRICCYFAQPVTPASARSLQPPAPVKQFLISPPSSPPLGWEPRAENEPLVCGELMAALARLAPGESHELHPRSDTQPAIVVHTARLDVHMGAPPTAPRIAPTRCPDH